jgi:hypothetical protein
MKYDIYITQVYAHILINFTKLLIGSRNNRILYFIYHFQFFYCLNILQSITLRDYIIMEEYHIY